MLVFELDPAAGRSARQTLDVAQHSFFQEDVIVAGLILCSTEGIQGPGEAPGISKP